MFSGSIVALVTPFNTDGEVDFDSLKSWLSTMLLQVVMVWLRLAQQVSLYAHY